MKLNVNKIAEYIIGHYPESCLAENIKMGHRYDETELMEECKHFFYYEKLGWCGCGCPEDAERCVLNLLSEIKVKTADVYADDLLLCLAYTLDHAGLLEHGTSIGGAWLTEEGKMYLYLLENSPEE